MSGVQLLGLCRFSYPTALDGFSDLSATAEENRARLYDDARLRLRFWFWENVCLPTLAAQDDPSFKVLLLHDEALPEPWKGRLLDGIATVPQIEPVALPAFLPHRETCNRLMRAARDPEARVTGEFTIDDDDGLARDFVSSMREAFQSVRPVWKQVGRAAIDFNRGIVVRAGESLSFEPVQSHLWAPATAVFCKPGSTRSIQDFNHRRLWSRIPTLTLPDPPMYLRGAHGTNDSNVSRAGKGAAGGADTREVIGKRFGLDADALARGWTAFRTGG